MQARSPCGARPFLSVTNNTCGFLCLGCRLLWSGVSCVFEGDTFGDLGGGGIGGQHSAPNATAEGKCGWWVHGVIDHQRAAVPALLAQSAWE